MELRIIAEVNVLIILNDQWITAQEEFTTPAVAKAPECALE